jgi:hypothetical protein
MEIMSEGMHERENPTFFSDHKGDSVAIRLFRTSSGSHPERSAEEWLQRVREKCYSLCGELETRITVFPALGGEDGGNNAAAVVGGYDILAYGEPDEDNQEGTAEQADSATIERIAKLCMDALHLDSECRTCPGRGHGIPAGILGMFNTLGWAITGEESHRMVNGALPMFGYLMGSGEAEQAAERMKETHPEVAELIHTIRKFAPGPGGA